MTIPPFVIAIGAIWNLIAWVWFGISYKIHPLVFLGIPFFVLACIYGWFSIADVSVDDRAQWVRGGLFLIVYAQAPILSLLALLKTDFRKKG